MPAKPRSTAAGTLACPRFKRFERHVTEPVPIMDDRARRPDDPERHTGGSVRATRRAVSVRIAPEWACYPLWVTSENDPISDNCSPERAVTVYGMPPELVAAINSWDDGSQAVYDPNDPANSGFPDETTTAAWHERGERLAEQLAAALPIPVEFHTARGDRVFNA
jgi:hypothetical protein